MRLRITIFHVSRLRTWKQSRGPTFALRDPGRRPPTRPQHHGPQRNKALSPNTADILTLLELPRETSSSAPRVSLEPQEAPAGLPSCDLTVGPRFGATDRRLLLPPRASGARAARTRSPRNPTLTPSHARRVPNPLCSPPRENSGPDPGGVEPTHRPPTAACTQLRYVPTHAPAAGPHRSSQSSHRPHRVHAGLWRTQRSPLASLRSAQLRVQESGFPGDRPADTCPRRPRVPAKPRARPRPYPRPRPHPLASRVGQVGPLCDLTGPTGRPPPTPGPRPGPRGDPHTRLAEPGPAASTSDTHLAVKQRTVGQPLGQGLPGGDSAKSSQRPPGRAQRPRVTPEDTEA